MSVQRLLARITSYLHDPAAAPGDELEQLALEAFAFQVETLEPYRRLCETRGISPKSVGRWQEIPLVPTSAFQTLELATAPAMEIFRSSGTTGGKRSVHHHPFPDLYRAAIDASFPHFCLPQGGPVSMLSLIPPREVLPDSSLSFMVDHCLATWGDARSAWAFSERLDISQARSWLGARQRSGQGGLILATGFALVELLDALARLDLRFRLPPGSAVFETGGLKGRTREVTRAELLRRLDERLGLSAQAVVGEYGMTELTSQCYTGSLLGEDPEIFLAPEWMRVRILDPTTLEEAAPGTVGLVAILDLANLGSAIHLLTEDLGVAEKEGFRLLGRAAGAELRGCSLTVEEMTSSKSSPTSA